MKINILNTIANKYGFKKFRSLIESSSGSTPASLVLTSPIGGESYAPASTQNITWLASGVLEIDIYYTIDNGSNWVSVATKYDATLETYSWTLPNSLSALCKVKIVENGGVLEDVSASTFTITLAATMLTKLVYNEGAGTFTMADEISTGRAITMETSAGGSTIYHRMINAYKGTNNCSHSMGGSGSNFAHYTLTHANSSDCNPSATGFTVWFYSHKVKHNNYQGHSFQKTDGSPEYGWKLYSVWDSGWKIKFTVTINGTAYTASYTVNGTWNGLPALGTPFIAKGEYDPVAGTVKVTYYKFDDDTSGTATTSSVPSNETWSTASLVFNVSSSNNDLRVAALGCYAGLLTADQWTAIYNYMKTRKAKDARPTYITNLLVFESDGAGSVRCKDVITEEVLTRVAENESQVSLVNGYNGSNNCCLITCTNSTPAVMRRYFEMAAGLVCTTGRSVTIFNKTGYGVYGGFGTGLYEASNGGWQMNDQPRYHLYFTQEYTLGYEKEMNFSGEWQMITGQWTSSNKKIDIFGRRIQIELGYWDQPAYGTNTNAGRVEVAIQSRTPAISHRSDTSYTSTHYWQMIAYSPNPLTEKQVEQLWNYLEKYYIVE